MLGHQILSIEVFVGSGHELDKLIKLLVFIVQISVKPKDQSFSSFCYIILKEPKTVGIYSTAENLNFITQLFIQYKQFLQLKISRSISIFVQSISIFVHMTKDENYKYLLIDVQNQESVVEKWILNIRILV